MTDFRFKPNERVRLKGEPSNLYERAYVGSEGWVRERKMDPVGFPIVKIEWDKSHWTYNGEKDMWTFEEHFESIDGAVKEMDDEGKTFMDRLAAFIAAEQAQQKQKPDEDASIIDNDDTEAKYNEVLEAATAYAKDCEAFLLVGVIRQHDESHAGRTILIPDIFAGYKSEDAGILLETQVSQLAAQFHQEIAGRVLGELMKEQRKNDEEE